MNLNNKKQYHTNRYYSVEEGTVYDPEAQVHVPGYSIVNLENGMIEHEERILPAAINLADQMSDHMAELKRSTIKAVDVSNETIN